MNERLGLWARIKARQLDTDIYAITVSAIVFAISTALYYSDPVKNEAFQEFQLALSTSLLAAIFLSAIDFYNKYKNFENARFIERLYGFGIKNLHFEKKDVLLPLIKNADDEIWISGYRLILTQQIAKALHGARVRGVRIRMLLCPPWSYTHGLVYPDVDRTIDRFIDLFSMIVSNDAADPQDIVIRFTEKPLFNDTYLCDHTIVASPYMHNRDIKYNVISANDFFTYEVTRGTPLFDLLKSEYETLFEDATYEIDEVGIQKALKRINDTRFELTYIDKAAILTDFLRPTKQDVSG